MGYVPEPVPTGRTTWQYVKARPEGGLVYPGAIKLRGISWSTHQAGTPSATYGGVFRTDDSPAQIYEWYGRWLQDHGWVLYRDCPRGGATVWLSDRHYRRGDQEVFTIAIDRPQRLGQVLGVAIPDEGTIFESTYSIYLPGRGIPSS